MPVLPSLPQADIKKFFLPSTAALEEAQQAWVTMDVSPVNVEDFLSVDPGDGEGMTRLGLKVISDRIKEWNFTEEDGSAVPINVKTIVRMGMENLGYLTAQMPQDDGVKLTIGQKKS